jgi:hypothetical protein
MGRLLATQPGSDQDRIRTAFRRCLTRPPAPAELDVLTRFLQAQRSRFTSGQLDPAPVAGPGDAPPAERAAWTTLARALLNTDEMITKD